MSQTSLFDQRPGHFHLGATQAEKDGATINQLGKAKQRHRVYELIAASSDGMTGFELSSVSGIPRHVLSGRLKELEDDGFIRKSGRRLAPTGVRNNIYVVAS